MLTHVGIRKKLNALASERVAYRVLYPWIPATVDHLYHVICNSTDDLRIEWWKSVVNHCCNIHTHDSTLFPQCKHGQLEEERVNPDGSKDVRVWINKCKLPVYNAAVFAGKLIFNFVDYCARPNM